jgi:hypothetical protein
MGFNVYAVEMASYGMIYMLNSMSTGTGVEVIRFCFSNLKDCNAGITDERIYELSQSL